MEPRGTPRQVTKLGMEIAAARVALSMIDCVAPTKGERILARAQRQIASAAEAASGAGHTEAAREVVEAARIRAPSSSVTDRWPQILDLAMERLAAG